MSGPRSGYEICRPSGESLENIAAQWVYSADIGLPLETKNNSFYREENYQVRVEHRSWEEGYVEHRSHRHHHHLFLLHQVKIRREGGLGLILAEMWCKGDGSGRGVVLVEEVVKGSNAAEAGGIEVGDTILGVHGQDGLGRGMSTQGMDWETTVAALTVAGSELTLSMQRLVKRGRINVQVTGSQGQDLGTFDCASGSNLRMEFLRRGLPKEEIYDPNTYRFDAIGNSGSNCGGEGSCGTCLVAVTQGNGLCGEPARVERMALARQGHPVRWRWSCRTVLGDGVKGGDVKIQLQPQRQIFEEQTRTGELGA
jgi:ferredoxin